MGSRRLLGRVDVLSATHGHPYARFATAAGTSIEGVTDGHAVLWVNNSHLGLLGHALGPLDAIADLLETARPLTEGASWINLPRHHDGDGDGDGLAGYHHDGDWDLRWLVQAPAPQPGEEWVIELTRCDAGEINELLDQAMPDTVVRPGSDVTRQFFGIRQGTSLVACGADRSSRIDHGSGGSVGVIGAIAVHPQWQRRGLGAAVTATVTRGLARAHPLVVLGQHAQNTAATGLYTKLGYTGVHHVTSVRVT